MDWITLQGVGKKFKSFDHPGDRVKELLMLGRRRYHKEYWALRDVSLSIRQGETFCVVGENGSGKTTLLKLITGILQPTTGSIAVKGRLSALLELGSGFSPEFTGRENVFLNGAILGFSNKEIQERLDEIFAFAEIGEAVDQPLKTYSSGMVVRLAFAVAVQMDPDILVVDEALSVGDVYFSQRCMRKIHALRDRGVTVIFVSHNIGDVKALGDRTLWLERGRVVELGKTRDVAQHYMAALVKKDSAYLKHESCRSTQRRIRLPNHPKSSPICRRSPTATATGEPRSWASVSPMSRAQGSRKSKPASRSSRASASVPPDGSACPSWAFRFATAAAWIFPAPTRAVKECRSRPFPPEMNLPSTSTCGCPKSPDTNSPSRPPSPRAP